MERSISKEDNTTELKTLLRNNNDIEIQSKMENVNVQISGKINDSFIQTEKNIEDQRKLIEIELKILIEKEAIIQRREIILKEEKGILQERETNVLIREKDLNMKENDIKDWEDILSGRIKTLNWREESLNERERIISEREKLMFKYLQKTSAIECFIKNREHILNEKELLLERREKLYFEKICCLENNKYICAKQEFLQKDKLHLKTEENFLCENKPVSRLGKLDIATCKKVKTGILAENHKTLDQMVEIDGKVTRDLQEVDTCQNMTVNKHIYFDSKHCPSTNSMSEDDNIRQKDSKFLTISYSPGLNSIWSYDQSVNIGDITNAKINSDAKFIPSLIPSDKIINDNSLKACTEHTVTSSPVKRKVTNEREDCNNFVNDNKHSLIEGHETKSSESKSGSNSENTSFYTLFSNSFDQTKDAKIKQKPIISKQEEKEPYQELYDLLRQIKSSEPNTCRKNVNNPKDIEISDSEEKPKLTISEDSNVEFHDLSLTHKETEDEKDTIHNTKSSTLDSQIEITSNCNVDNLLQPQGMSFTNASYPPLSGFFSHILPPPCMMTYSQSTFLPCVSTPPFQMHNFHNSNTPLLPNINLFPQVPQQLYPTCFPPVFQSYVPTENSHLNLPRSFRLSMGNEIMSNKIAVKEKEGCILTPVSTGSEMTSATSSSSVSFKEIVEASKSNEVIQPSQRLVSNDESAAGEISENATLSIDLKPERLIPENDHNVCQTVISKKHENENMQLMPNSSVGTSDDVSSFKSKRTKNSIGNPISGGSRDIKRILRKRHVLQEALFHAVNMGTFHDAVDLIDNLDIPLNCRDNDGFTPFLLAVKKSDLDLVQWLVDKGANTRVYNYDGQSALHIAVAANNEEVLTFLLQSGNKPNITNNNGNTPMELAYELGNDNMVKIIKEFSKKE